MSVEVEVPKQLQSEETLALVESFRDSLDRIRVEVGKVIIGQEGVVDHLLLTLLVRTLADALGLTFNRIQFTPDLMPTDVTGTDIIEEDITTGHRTWTFVPGPIFANVLLADEINRTPPKTQSALLEAMQEFSVTVRGNHHSIERPFFVLATQNPIELEGTYPLPEAQLDRFLFNVILDYLTGDEEVEVVNRYTTRMDIPAVTACTTPEQIMKFQWLVRQVPVAESVNRYAVDLVRATRPEDPLATEVVRKYIQYGASVRATMFLTLAAKARALMNERYHVTRDDITALVLLVLRHRVLTNYFAESDNMDVDKVLVQLLEEFEGSGLQARAG